MLATANPGKLRELEQILGRGPWRVISQADFGVSAVAETGHSFVENALLKARHAAEVCQHPAIGDDSGLMVDALDGAPGLYSARYAGEGAGDAENTAKLLRALAETPLERRSARFVCVAVFVRHAEDPLPLIAQGLWEGAIAGEPRGDGGFGYDPVFRVADLDVSAAELEATVKNRISHRGQALATLADWLRALA